MTSVDDLLFEPILILSAWRKKCRIVADYIENMAPTYKPMKQIYPIDRPRPAGSLLLEQLLELYHDKGHRDFYYAIAGNTSRSVNALVFDGGIIFGKYEDGEIPILSGFNGRRSIRDLNLVPNTYTRHYVFASGDEARLYINSLS
jgi:hypothetical protein